MLTKSRLYGLIAKLVPSKYETMPKETHLRSIKADNINYIIFNRERFYETVNSGLSFIRSQNPVICDIGVYPGTLIHILDAYFREEGIKPVFHGAGLFISDEFKQYMRDNFSAPVYTVNIDPENQDLKAKSYPTVIPLADNSVDLVFATEIIEHLTNPIPMLKEMHRILKPGGAAVITTPNVTRIGNIFKLLVGISNHDRLMPPGYSNPDDEWRPHFREYSMKDLNKLFKDIGFRIAEEKHFLGDQTVFNKKSLKQLVIDTLKKPFYLVPHFRGTLLMAAVKAVK